jgi:8-hydroxy-5-deazaflavin:NADPH oxidoreductase
MSGQSNLAVSILGGTGALGFGLALRLGCHGVPVTIGSRSAERAAEAAGRAAELLSGKRIAGATNQQAVTAGEIVVLTVPFVSHAETLKAVAEHLRDG